MCAWGDEVSMEVPVSARKSHTGKRYMKTMPIDRCIAPIIKALLDAGIETEESCCGHGKLGYIALMDGRCLGILDSQEAWKELQGFRVSETSQKDPPDAS